MSNHDVSVNCAARVDVSYVRRELELECRMASRDPVWANCNSRTAGAGERSVGLGLSLGVDYDSGSELE